MHTCRICNKQNIPENSIQIYCKDCRDRIEKDKENQKPKKPGFEGGGFENLKKIFNFE